MGAPRDEVDQLAYDVADGSKIDWEQLESTDPQDGRLLNAFRTIFQIKRFFLEVESPGDSLSEWGHLEVREKVAEGSYGEVYRAYDPVLDREVALKLLHDELSTSGGETGAVEEGRLLAQVRHQHVVTVYGARHSHRRTGLWMEFVEGRPLNDLVDANGPFSADEASTIGIRLCSALAAVHSRDIIHCDIKAQNVMREEGGRIVLMDFGIGRRLRQITSSSDAAGTPFYCAPEVLEGEKPSRLSDIYSLGVLLYYLVTGRFPLEERTLDQLRQAHRDGKKVHLRDRRSDLPPEFVAVVEKSLQTDPAHRYQSCGECEQALHSLIAGPGKRLLSRRAVLAASALGIGAALSFGVWSDIFSSHLDLKALQKEFGALFQAGEFEEARALLNSRVEEYSDHPILLSQIGFLYYALGSQKEAFDWCREAWDKRHTVESPPERLLIEGRALFLRNDFLEAVRRFNEAQAALNDEQARSLWRWIGRQGLPDVRGLRYAAQTFGEMGDLKTGLQIAMSALERNPDDGSTAGLVVRYQWETMELEKALGTAAAKVTHYVPIIEAMIALRDRDFKGALCKLQKARSLSAYWRYFANRLEAVVNIRRGLLEMALGQLEDSYPANVKRLAFYMKSRRWQAWIHHILDDRLKALNKLNVQEWNTNAPRLLMDYREAALLAFLMGAPEKLDDILRAAKSLFSTYDAPYNKAAVEHIRGLKALLENRHSVAYRDLDNARKHINDVLLKWSLAELARGRGDFKGALDQFEAIIGDEGAFQLRFFPGLWVLAHLESGRSHAQLGHVGPARKRYQDFLGIWNDSGSRLIGLARREMKALG